MNNVKIFIEYVWLSNGYIKNITKIIDIDISKYKNLEMFIGQTPRILNDDDDLFKLLSTNIKNISLIPNKIYKIDDKKYILLCNKYNITKFISNVNELTNIILLDYDTNRSHTHYTYINFIKCMNNTHIISDMFRYKKHIIDECANLCIDIGINLISYTSGNEYGMWLIDLKSCDIDNLIFDNIIFLYILNIICEKNSINVLSKNFKIKNKSNNFSLHDI